MQDREKITVTDLQELSVYAYPQIFDESESAFINYFAKSYPQSIAITHKDYVVERCRRRKLYIYGISAEAICLAKYLSSMNIETVCFIDDEQAGGKLKGKDIISSIDIVYEVADKIFIIVAKVEDYYGVSRQKFLDIGMIEDIDFTYHSEIPLTKEPKCFDVTLSYNRVVEEIEGFEVYGDIGNPQAIKIVALGGSTTESTYLFIKGWVQFLSELLCKNKVPSIVYGGGVAGYSSSQELLKLIRDVLPLKPDIVLSYSGFNDLYGYPKPSESIRHGRPFITHFQVEFVEQILEKLSMTKNSLPVMHDLLWDKKGRGTVYYGLKNDKSPSELWLDNTRIMHSITQEFKIEFLSFFQPFAFNGFYEESDLQNIIYSRRSLSCLHEGYEKWGKPYSDDLHKIMTEIKNYNYISDFSDIFTEYRGVYFDASHVYEQGNQIIAKEIYYKLVPYLRRGKFETTNL